jgi:hypothetical protein
MFRPFDKFNTTENFIQLGSTLADKQKLLAFADNPKNVGYFYTVKSAVKEVQTALNNVKAAMNKSNNDFEIFIQTVKNGELNFLLDKNPNKPFSVDSAKIEMINNIMISKNINIAEDIYVGMFNFSDLIGNLQMRFTNPLCPNNIFEHNNLLETVYIFAENSDGYIRRISYSTYDETPIFARQFIPILSNLYGEYLKSIMNTYTTIKDFEQLILAVQNKTNKLTD